MGADETGGAQRAPPEKKLALFLSKLWPFEASFRGISHFKLTVGLNCCVIRGVPIWVSHDTISVAICGPR